MPPPAQQQMPPETNLLGNLQRISPPSATRSRSFSAAGSTSRPAAAAATSGATGDERSLQDVLGDDDESWQFATRDRWRSAIAFAALDVRFATCAPRAAAELFLTDFEVIGQKALGKGPTYQGACGTSEQAGPGGVRGQNGAHPTRRRRPEDSSGGELALADVPRPTSCGTIRRGWSTSVAPRRRALRRRRSTPLRQNVVARVADGGASPRTQGEPSERPRAPARAPADGGRGGGASGDWSGGARRPRRFHLSGIAAATTATRMTTTTTAAARASRRRTLTTTSAPTGDGARGSNGGQTGGGRRHGSGADGYAAAATGSARRAPRRGRAARRGRCVHLLRQILRSASTACARRGSSTASVCVSPETSSSTSA